LIKFSITEFSSEFGFFQFKERKENSKKVYDEKSKSFFWGKFGSSILM
jgi:hypothetical protein